MTQIFTDENAFDRAEETARKVKYSATQIKHDDMLTTAEIAAIPIQMVYMWTRSGAWKQKDFIKWLTAVKDSEIDTYFEIANPEHSRTTVTHQ